MEVVLAHPTHKERESHGVTMDGGYFIRPLSLDRGDGPQFSSNPSMVASKSLNRLCAASIWNQN